MSDQKNLMSSISNFANAQETEYNTGRVYEYSLAVALTFLQNNPEALERIAMAAVEAAAEEEVDVHSSDMKEHTKELESYSDHQTQSKEFAVHFVDSSYNEYWYKITSTEDLESMSDEDLEMELPDLVRLSSDTISVKLISKMECINMGS